MPDDVFQKHVTALAVKRLEKPKKLSVQNARYWSEIGNQLYNFHRGTRLLCILYMKTSVISWVYMYEGRSINKLQNSIILLFFQILTRNIIRL